MTEHPIDELVAAAARIGDEEVAALDLNGLDLELREAIMSTQTPQAIDVATPSRDPSARRRTPLKVLLAAAIAALVALAVVVSPLGRTRDSAWAAEVLAVAEASPRLLVDLPGWTVVRAHSFTVELGEMTFSDGDLSLDLHWRPADTHQDYLSDRAASSEPARETAVNGKPATQFQYVGTTDFTTLWLEGAHSFEARGVFADRDAFEEVLDALTGTDVDTWLRAMPESVVKPDGRAAVITEMLADIPQPSGLDVAGLVDGADISDRYQLGARVSGAVACSWIAQWLDARDRGDVAAESEALEAMQTSRNWAILLEMSESGAYPQVFWLHIDAMEAGGTDPQGLSISGYGDALGCN